MLFDRAADTEILSRTWDCEPRQLYLLSQASHALTLVHAGMHAAGRADPEYWFPAYFGGDTVRPLMALRARYRFYPVKDDFTPDWQACEAMAAERPPDLFTVAHYFGVEGDIAGARAFCDRHRSLLHEDVAHALLPYGNVGRHADFVSYSPRKFVHMPDGGLLVARSEEAAAHAEIAARQLAGRPHATLDWRWAEMRRAWRWPKLRRRIREMIKGPKVRRRHKLKPVTLDDDPINPPPFESIWMSGTSRSMLRRLAERGEVIAIARRRADRVLAVANELTTALSLRHVAPVPGAAPRWTAFRADDEAATLAAIATLRSRGIDAHTWPRLAPEVKAEPHRYGAAWTIRRTLIRVPTGGG